MLEKIFDILFKGLAIVGLIVMFLLLAGSIVLMFYVFRRNWNEALLAFAIVAVVTLIGVVVVHFNEKAKGRK